MPVFITAFLALLGEIAPTVTAASTIGNIIGSLTALIPTLTQEYTDVMPIVKNIIADLQGNPASTADQLTQLAALDAQVDQAFEAAATAAQAQDAASA